MFNVANLETLTVIVVRSIQMKTLYLRKIPIGIVIMRRAPLLQVKISAPFYFILLVLSEHNTQVSRQDT